MARRIDPIKIEFLDESGAGLYCAVAFRFGATSHLPESKIAELHLAARRSGFQYDEFRMCWLRNYVTDSKPLIGSLLKTVTAEGFDVETVYPSRVTRQIYTNPS